MHKFHLKKTLSSFGSSLSVCCRAFSLSNAAPGVMRQAAFDKQNALQLGVEKKKKVATYPPSYKNEELQENLSMQNAPLPFLTI